jgi:DNA-binding Lrp family transcriptional regulator
MIGLKAFIPQLSKALNISETALYERQRALVRAGLLEHTGGRGPGSGVRLSAEAVAMMLIAVLATDSLSETEAATRLLAKAKRGRGPAYKKFERSLGDAQTFKDALVNALSSDEVASQTKMVRVYRQDCVGCFLTGHGDEVAAEFFSSKKAAPTELHVIAELSVPTMHNLLRQTEKTSKPKAKDAK